VERYYRSYSRQGLACHHARNIADKTGRPFGRAAAKFVSAPEAYRVSCELNDTYRKRRQLFLRDDRKRSCRSHTTQASALHRHARHVLREYSYEHDSRTPLRAVERSGVSSSNAFASDTQHQQPRIGLRRLLPRIMANSNIVSHPLSLEAAFSRCMSGICV
jgi:hypothetical protein